MITNSLRIGTENEVNFCNVIGKVFGKKHSDFTYVCGQDKESREILDNTIGDKVYGENFPFVMYKTKLQKYGADFLYNDLITLDLKVTGKHHNRAWFDLYMVDGEYRYKQVKDSHVIITIMHGKEIYSFPTGLIEDIVNKQRKFDLPADFYINNNYFQSMGEKAEKNNIYGFCINPDILQECLNDYIPLYCNNSLTRKLFFKSDKYVDNDYTYKEEKDN